MRYLILIVCILAGSAFANDEISERNQLKILAYSLFSEERFDELEQLASNYRQDDVRTSSGTLKYPLIYRGVSATNAGIHKDDDGAWQQQLDRADKWIKLYPESPTARIARASILISRASNYRGTRFIKNTPKSDIEMARKYFSEAATYLIENQNLGKKDPRWFRSMLLAYTNIGASNEEYFNLFHEAIETFPGHDDFYFNATVFYSPQYGGSSKAIDELAMLAMKNTQAERGYELYARVYWAATPLPDGRLHLMEDDINWEYFLLGVDAVLKKYPTQWNLNHLAFFVCMREDWEKTSELMLLLKEPLIPSAWQNEANIHYCKVWTDRWRANHQSSQ